MINLNIPISEAVKQISKTEERFKSKRLPKITYRMLYMIDYLADGEPHRVRDIQSNAELQSSDVHWSGRRLVKYGFVEYYPKTRHMAYYRITELGLKLHEATKHLIPMI